MSHEKKISICNWKEFSLKRRIKRHRFSSSFFLDEKNETKFESNINNYVFVELYRIFNISNIFFLFFLSLDRERKSKFNNKHKNINKIYCQYSLFRTEIIYEQQYWKEKILQERNVKQKRERFRKQYLIRWKKSWVNNARLAFSNLLRNWTKKRCRVTNRLFISDEKFIVSKNISDTLISNDYNSAHTSSFIIIKYTSCVVIVSKH